MGGSLILLYVSLVMTLSQGQHYNFLVFSCDTQPPHMLVSL